MFNNYKGKWHNKRISEFDYNEQLEEQYTKAFKRFIIIAIVTLIVSIVFGILLSINDGRKNCMGINWKDYPQMNNGVIDGTKETVQLWYIISWVIVGLLFIIGSISTYLIFYTWKLLKEVRTWLVNASELIELEEKKLQTINAKTVSYLEKDETLKILEERKVLEKEDTKKVVFEEENA